MLHARAEFGLLVPERSQGVFLLRSEPGFVEPMQTRLGLDQEEAIYNGEKRGDAH